MSEPLVRAYRAEDREAVVAAIQSTPAFTAEEVVVALEVLDGALSGEYPHLVVERDGVVWGYVCVGPTPMTESTWHLYWICVHPSAEGGGLGRALQAGAERFVAAGGGRRIVLETGGKPEYERQRRFYRGVGYVEVGRVPDFYCDGDDGVTFVKLL